MTAHVDAGATTAQIKRRIGAPRVPLYSAYADASLAIPALLAGADGLMHKGAPAGELYGACGWSHAATGCSPALTRAPPKGGRAPRPRGPPDLGLVIDETPRAEIARVLALEPRELDARIERMIARLRVEVPESAG